MMSVRVFFSIDNCGWNKNITYDDKFRQKNALSDWLNHFLFPVVHSYT